MASISFKYGGHGVAESTKIKATTCGHIFNAVAEEDIDNGSFVSLGDYAEADVYEAAKPVKGSAAYLVLSVPLIYNNFNSRISEADCFYNAAGEIIRAYEIVSGDVVAFSADCFSVTVAKGDTVYVVPSAYKMSKTSTDAILTGTIIDVDRTGKYLVKFA